MTPQRQLELSRSLSNSITRSTQYLRSIRQNTSDRTRRVGTNATTAEHLIKILARIWATELGENINTRLLGILTDRDVVHQSPARPTGGIPYSPLRRRELLPPKDRADQWLQTYLNGPNKLMHICSPTESQHLLSSLYNQHQEIGPKSECLITWQLALGARYTADVDQQTYTAIYESARMQTEASIEEDDDMLLWLVPTLLLRCVYLMDSQPRHCWLILGKSNRFC